MLVSLREKVRLLSVSDTLEPLSDEELEELGRQNPDIRLQEGEIFFSPEEAAERLYLVKEGRIRLYKVGPKGNRITIAMVNQGRMFGEMALMAQRLREVYAQAAQPSLLISLSQEALKELFRSNPG